METIISALLYMGLTIGAYFYDYKGANRKNKVFSGILFLAMLLSLISWQSLLSIKRSQRQEDLQIINASLQEKLAEQEKRNEQLEDELQAHKIKMVDDPDKSSSEQVLLNNLYIQYFSRGGDPQKLADRLKELESNNNLEELSLLNCQPPDCSYQSNAIWYGADVEIEQVQAIAKLLISSGINIKVIRPFFEPDRRPGNLVQIGVERRALTCKTWQKEDILEAEAFSTNRLGCP
jgi:hypothetical protein